MKVVSGRKDIKTEFQIMASALSKEMGMMESQVKRWKDTAHEAVALREEAQSIEALLRNKVSCFLHFHSYYGQDK